MDSELINEMMSEDMGNDNGKKFPERIPWMLVDSEMLDGLGDFTILIREVRAWIKKIPFIPMDGSDRIRSFAPPNWIRFIPMDRELIAEMMREDMDQQAYSDGPSGMGGQYRELKGIKKHEQAYSDGPS